MEHPFPNSGGLPSPYDARDVKISLAATAAPLLAKYQTDISKYPIWYQAKIGACVGHALAKLAQHYFYIKTGKVINFSPRFLYAMAKCQDNYLDEGTYPRLVADIMHNVGCATEDTCLNDTTLDHETYVYQRKLSNIPQEALKEAALYKIPGYIFVDPKNDALLKAAINRYGMVSILLQIGAEWYTAKDGRISWAKEDVDPLRPPKVVISGHETALYGWDNNSYLDLNSWSEDWADKGVNRYDADDYRKYAIEAIALTDKFLFNKDLEFGMTDPDILELQKRLNTNPLTQVSTTGAGAPGQETTHFGYATKAAVIKYQKLNKISPSIGFVGPITRGVLNS